MYKYIKTSGPLNRINEKYRLNSPYKLGFSVSQIIKELKPKNEQELLDIIGTETIDRLGDALYDAQKVEGHDFLLETCRNYQYSLIIVNSYRGFKMEKKALKMLIEECYDAEEATDVIDLKYAVDIVVKKYDRIIGIQVKPISYINLEDSIKKINRDKNNEFKKDWNGKVFYLFYDGESFTTETELWDFLNKA